MPSSAAVPTSVSFDRLCRAADAIATLVVVGVTPTVTMTSAAPAASTLETPADSISARHRSSSSAASATGASSREVARDLRISEAIVKTHLLHLYEKLGVGDRTNAVTTALERGLTELPNVTR
jgi:DNA-binding NarL/FixJ family response regulator